MKTSINQELILAYEQAKYIVEINEGLELRVGLKSEELDETLRKNNAYFAAFITPENPYSKQLTDEENAERHRSFLHDLEINKIDYLEGYGVDDEELWPREKSYLVFVKSKAAAKQLSQKYGQNAYVLCELNKPTALILCS